MVSRYALPARTDGISLAMRAAAAILGLAIAAGAAAQPTTRAQTPHVIVLISYSSTFATSAHIVRGVEQVLGDHAKIDIEYMELRYLPDRQSLERYADWLRYRLQKAPTGQYDLVVASDDSALQLLATYPDLFPRTPKVFIGVNDVELALSQNDNPWVTGIVEAISPRENFDLIRTLQADLGNIYLIADNSHGGREDLATTLASVPDELYGRVQVLSLRELTWDALRSRLAALTANDAVMLLAAYEDQRGETLDFADSLALIESASAAPIYHMWPHGLGDGVLGGHMVSHGHFARVAADIGLRILQGASISDIPVVTQSPNRYLFDYRELTDHAISLRRVPTEAEILYQPPGFWQKHGNAIVAGGAATLVLGAIAATLAWLLHRQRRVTRILRRTRRRLAKSERRYTVATQAARVGVWECDLKKSGGISWNEVCYELHNRDPGTFQVTQEAWYQLVNPDDRERLSRMIRLSSLAEEDTCTVEYRVPHADGSVRLCQGIGQIERNEAGMPSRILGVVRDITDERAQAAAVARRASHDDLTGLMNRRSFLQTVERLLARSDTDGPCHAILFVDLDNFKEINDALGHRVGDQIIRHCAERLRGCTREQDWVSRLGGDEFTVFVSAVADAGEAMAYANRIVQTFEEPLKLGSELVHLTASVGVTMFPDDGTTADMLISNADQALYSAKQTGRNCAHRFTTIMGTQLQDRHNLRNDLWHALEANELEIHFQPIIDYRVEAITKVEALLRWTHADRGLISPAVFITLAEDMGIMPSLGYAVLELVLKNIDKLNAAGFGDIGVTINKSPREFANPKQEAHWFERVKAANLRDGQLTVEITERLLLDPHVGTIELLRGYRAAGLTIAIDDFGTGYASLQYLSRYPIDYLKIDKSFVQELERRYNDQAIVQGVIGLGRRLGVKVIAEGVERLAQEALLKQHGCDMGQGFLYSKAVPMETIIELLGTGKMSFQKSG